MASAPAVASRTSSREPVAAAACVAGPVAFEGTVVTHGTTAEVFDLGAGTFDATVIRRGPDGIDVLAAAGLPDVGGLGIVPGTPKG